ncbi:2-dehydro-3-deoxy-6-phosphogalactonate aldolase [Symbiodinium microadriaticum]|uniref:2-dehydro-3-deoxy-6-phosphogalactonate aldolase n=1 Tax=Symbiodinium microadriaticum TaxID=2951 RepID=A0A1Q9D8S8_SYMMI|nr:2-dehydro-3-deoxy-6-phosphogalactonate aldolase [Symbiodinium microadriaticum]
MAAADEAPRPKRIATFGEAMLRIFTILPEQKTVHYQRRHSVFAQQVPEELEWRNLLSDASWLHLTGITPLVSAAARQSWASAAHMAEQLGVPISLDLNHRPQLGTLQELWDVVSPFCRFLEVLILSVDQLHGLAEGHLKDYRREDADEHYVSTMISLQQLWKCKRLALCRKESDSCGVQQRWSIVTEMSGSGVPMPTSTRDTPVWHSPKDPCGGGSAWAAGLLNALHCEALPLPKAMRRADLLSALCQDTEGDFSQVTSTELCAAEAQFEGRAAKPTSTPAVPREPGGLAEAQAKVEATLLALKQAMEVTLDSTDWLEVLGKLRRRLPADVLLGVGTVMDESVSQIVSAKAAGASFALSPIDPTGFVEECHRHGLLAIPSAFTSNECWALHRRGTRLIKLFPAGLLSPAILKSMLDITPLGQSLNILPSGSVTPENGQQWLEAGAAVIGMGSNLVGKDVSYPPGTPEFTKARADWTTKGRVTAEKLFKELLAD